jgi:serine/threonine protein kinase
LIRECGGIAYAMEQIHQYQGSWTPERLNDTNTEGLSTRYINMKPQDILLYKRKGDLGDRGTLQLTNFRPSKFHAPQVPPQPEAGTPHPSAIPRMTPTYFPPEGYLSDGTASRSFDIWSLGCVYLEFVTWYLGGYDYVSQFDNARLCLFQGDSYKTDHFYERVQDPDSGLDHAQVKKAVVEVSSHFAAAAQHRVPQLCKTKMLTNYSGYINFTPIPKSPSWCTCFWTSYRSICW